MNTLEVLKSRKFRFAKIEARLVIYNSIGNTSYNPISKKGKSSAIFDIGRAVFKKTIAELPAGDELLIQVSTIPSGMHINEV